MKREAFVQCHGCDGRSNTLNLLVMYGWPPFGKWH